MNDSPLHTPAWVGNGGRQPNPADRNQPCTHCHRIGSIAAATQDALHQIGDTLTELHKLVTLRDDITRALIHAGHPIPAQPGIYRTGGPHDPQLSHRELAVLEALAAGLPNARIAADCNVTIDTISSQIKDVYRRLRARNRAHAVARGYDLGWLQPGAAGGPTDGGGAA